MYQAMLWIHERNCRVIVRDSEGRTVDVNEEWNNRCSAEMWVMDVYPGCKITFLHHGNDQIKDWNTEFSACVNG